MGVLPKEDFWLVVAHQGSEDEQEIRAAADGLNSLARMADGYGLDVVVENHGGLSSDGAWLAGVIRAGDHSRLGTLPDFGNFRIDADTVYDPYLGVEELMPLARAVSAKSYGFDPVTGVETRLDYERLLRTVHAAGYRGWVGVEFEGGDMPEVDGVRATIALLERLRAEIA